MTRKRTDVHRPAALVTEDYEFVGCGYYGSADEPGYSPLTHEAKYLLDEGWTFGDSPGGGNCDHCGARIKYWAILKHIPSHTLIRVGETCLDNRFERTTAEFHALRKQAQLDREQHRIKARREEWLAESADNRAAAEFLTDRVIGHDDYGYGGFYHSLYSKLNRYGELSEKQVAAALKAAEREAKYAAERAEREAAEPEGKPVIEGRIEITGTILAVKFVDNDFGGTLKMLVRDDRGFKVWGTRPNSLRTDWEWREGEGHVITQAVAGKGDRITFTATVEKSDDDETFGFFKRPTKATLIEKAETTEEEDD